MTKFAEHRIQTLSKKLSWLLRHGANESGLAMDTAGFANVDDVIRITGFTLAEVDAVVAENNKQRFDIDIGAAGVRIRAVQGHSEGTPVTREGLEASWTVVEPETQPTVFHGTSVEAAEAILAGPGVTAQARSHVHLAASTDAEVGKRAGVAVLLAIDVAVLKAHGQQVFRANNGVLLTREVPIEAIVDVVAMTRAGELARAELLALVHH